MEAPSLEQGASSTPWRAEKVAGLARPRHRLSGAHRVVTLLMQASGLGLQRESGCWPGHWSHTEGAVCRSWAGWGLEVVVGPHPKLQEGHFGGRVPLMAFYRDSHEGEVCRGVLPGAIRGRAIGTDQCHEDTVFRQRVLYLGEERGAGPSSALWRAVRMRGSSHTWRGFLAHSVLGSVLGSDS